MKKISVISLIIFIIITGIVPCGYKKTGNKEDSAESPGSFMYVVVDKKYMTFEETLLKATDIVCAKYTGNYETSGIYCDLIFEPIYQLKGSGIDDNFYVSTYEQTIDVNDASISSSNYQEGAIYVLILEKYVSVYNSHDLYMPLENIFIADNVAATMYEDQPVNHTDGKYGFTEMPIL